MKNKFSIILITFMSLLFAFSAQAQREITRDKVTAKMSLTLNNRTIERFVNVFESSTEPVASFEIGDIWNKTGTDSVFVRSNVGTWVLLAYNGGGTEIDAFYERGDSLFLATTTEEYFIGYSVKENRFSSIDELRSSCRNIKPNEVVKIGAKNLLAVAYLEENEIVNGYTVDTFCVRTEKENYFRFSEDMTNSSIWVRVASSFTIEENKISSPFNDKTAELVTAVTNPEIWYANTNSTSFKVGEKWYWSFYWRATANTLGKTITLNGGQISGAGASNVSPLTMVTTDTLWRRYEIEYSPITAPITNPIITMGTFSGMVAGDKFGVYGHQLSRNEIQKQSYVKTGFSNSVKGLMYLKPFVIGNELFLNDVLAKGDTNDGNRLRAALEYCSNNKIGKVILQGNTEADSISIPNNVGIDGRSVATSITFTGSAKNAVSFQDDGSGQPFGSFITNLTLYGNSSNDTIVNMRSVRNAHIENVNINGSGVSDGNIGLYLGVYDDPEHPSPTLGSLANKAVNVSSSYNGVGMLYEGSILSKFTNSRFNANGIGAHLTSGTLKFDNCWFENNNSTAILIDNCNDVTIYDTYFESNNLTDDTISIKVTNTDVINILNNNFGGSSNTKTPIYFQNYQNGLITGNDFGQGVRMYDEDGSGELTQFSNNDQSVSYDEPNRINNFASENAQITLSNIDSTNNFNNIRLTDWVNIENGFAANRHINFTPRNDAVAGGAWNKVSLSVNSVADTREGFAVDSITLNAASTYLAIGNSFFPYLELENKRWYTVSFYAKTDSAGIVASVQDYTVSSKTIIDDGNWHRYEFPIYIETVNAGTFHYRIFFDNGNGKNFRFSSPQFNRGKVAVGYIENTTGGAAISQNAAVLESENGEFIMRGNTSIETLKITNLKNISSNVSDLAIIENDEIKSISKTDMLADMGFISGTFSVTMPSPTNDTLINTANDFGMFSEIPEAGGGTGKIIHLSYVWDMAIANSTTTNVVEVPLSVLGVSFDSALDGLEAHLTGNAEQLNTLDTTLPVKITSINSNGACDCIQIEYLNTGTYSYPDNHFRFKVNGSILK